MKPLSLLLAVALGERTPQLCPGTQRGEAEEGDPATCPTRGWWWEAGSPDFRAAPQSRVSRRLGDRSVGGPRGDRVLAGGGRRRGPFGQETRCSAAAPGSGGTTAPARPRPRALP